MTAINSNRAIRGPVTAVPVVAGKGVRLTADTENNRWIVEADETVLWEATALTDHTTSCNLSESMTNFEQIQVMFQTNNDNRFFCTYPGDPKFISVETVVVGNNNTVFHKYASFSITNDSKTLTRQYCCEHSNSNSPAASDVIWLYKIVGINRISASA